MMDLFGWADAARYPNAPGYKERTTSKEAAKKMGMKACNLRGDVLAELERVWPAGLTADETAAVLGKSVLAVRPRFTELRELNLILTTTARRKNASGMSAIVWVARAPENR